MFSHRTNWNLDRNQLSEALAKHHATNKPLIDLTRSNPTECAFNFRTNEILQAFNNPAMLRYQPHAQGLPQAREAVVAYCRARRTQIPIDDIFLATSTSEAYSFLFRLLCNPGDEVLIPHPGYPLFNFLADIQDVTLVRYPLLYDDGWQIDFHALQQSVSPRTRAIAVVHPNNPTGHFCKPAEIQQINEIAAAHRLAIISDEVFLDFSFSSVPPATFAANSSALTFTVSGISKICGLPQMKVAWLIASGPESLKIQAISRLEMIADTYLSMNAPVQLALTALLDQRHSFREQWLQRAQTNLTRLDELLASKVICSRLQLEGGWYAVLKTPLTATSEDLAVKLLETRGVYVHPGNFYEFPSSGYLIISLITPPDEFSSGITSLLEMLQIA
jgi:alanine-synthesizing transaminase